MGYLGLTHHTTRDTVEPALVVPRTFTQGWKKPVGFIKKPSPPGFYGKTRGFLKKNLGFIPNSWVFYKNIWVLEI